MSGPPAPGDLGHALMVGTPAEKDLGHQPQPTINSALAHFALHAAIAVDQVVGWPPL